MESREEGGTLGLLLLQHEDGLQPPEYRGASGVELAGLELTGSEQDEAHQRGPVKTPARTRKAVRDVMIVAEAQCLCREWP